MLKYNSLPGFPDVQISSATLHLWIPIHIPVANTPQCLCALCYHRPNLGVEYYGTDVPSWSWWR